jgi:hypothetical protein
VRVGKVDQVGTRLMPSPRYNSDTKVDRLTQRKGRAPVAGPRSIGCTAWCLGKAPAITVTMAGDGIKAMAKWELPTLLGVIP